jgi:hypothetical protein
MDCYVINSCERLSIKRWRPILFRSKIHRTRTPGALPKGVTALVDQKAAEQAMPADVAERALPGR